MPAAPGSTPDPPLSQLHESFRHELASLETKSLRRSPVAIEAAEGSRVRIDGRWAVCWCSNDYLGLSSHPRLKQAASAAALEWGMGPRASRLLAGSTVWHRRLEAALAGWFDTEDAVVFGSGYLANLGALGTLAGPDDVVYLDRLAHASLLDAARATKARLRVFRHNDAGHVKRLLSTAPARGRRLVVTEGLFSMDGDAAPLAELRQIACEHDAVLYVDDAHGAFVRGPTGRGSCEAAGVPMSDLLYMATLGKALGCQGGFVAGPRAWTDWLRNRARTYIYATSPAVPVAAAAVEALTLLRESSALREALGERVERFSRQLRVLGPAASGTHIVPVVFGSVDRALAAARLLWERSHWAPAIRPPTVPEGTARLRLSVTALHTDDEIRSVVEALGEALAASGP